MRRPFSLLLPPENGRERRSERGERTPAASVRFQDNYLHQIESRLEFHGGKQKRPPLARMLTRQQEKKEMEERRRILKCSFPVLYSDDS